MRANRRSLVANEDTISIVSPSRSQPWPRPPRATVRSRVDARRRPTGAYERARPGAFRGGRSRAPRGSAPPRRRFYLIGRRSERACLYGLYAPKSTHTRLIIKQRYHCVDGGAPRPRAVDARPLSRGKVARASGVCASETSFPPCGRRQR